MSEEPSGKVGKDSIDEATHAEFTVLKLLAHIREAVGDPTGKLMQDELVKHCQDIYDRLTRAEVILGRLADGFWVSTLNEAGDPERLGDQVLQYWRDCDSETEPSTPQ